MTPEQWRRLNQLFHAAREQPPERHAAFIETHCADDEVLRHELSALLNAAKQSVHQFSAPVWEDVAALLPATDDAQVAAMQLTVGQRLLDRFDILRHLGSGGMGEVWAAYDWRLRRDVALKLLPARFTADVERVWRFDLEARATSALNHPNILTVYDIGAHEGAPCIVMELLEGANLRALLPPQAAPLSIRTALDYARQIAAGLAAAHEKNIVHRDLKPENLFVVKGGNVKILDFGLAKLKLPKSAAEFGSGNSQTRPNHLTGAGALIGTSGYMSPEQVRGEDVDHRSDLFSFGLILYEMLTGQQAFPQKNRMDALAAILKDDPPKLDALTEFNSQISLALEKIVQHCLEKNPDLRFQSARDLSFALDALSLPSGPRPAVPAMEDVAVASPM
ncbi:MAG TPA: serine/threonine-protein kinase, partial [Blastocatellia bacterium]|nr:serine/threonine-protein kinase [Blastocatellia bacterium]